MPTLSPLRRSLLPLLALALPLLASGTHAQPATALRFEVTAAPGLLPQGPGYPLAGRGRLVVAIAPGAGDLRFRLQDAGAMRASRTVALGRDVDGFSSASPPAVVDRTAFAFPADGLAKLAPGDYTVQAALDVSADDRRMTAPGNLYSRPERVHLDPAQGAQVRLQLTETVPPERLPQETEYVRYVEVPSALLSRFRGRPVTLRAGIILPRDWAKEPERRYPLWVMSGGYGTRRTLVSALMNEQFPLSMPAIPQFRRDWTAEDAPRFVLMLADNVGPHGTPYWVNSETDGPYGDALTQELIPAVEKQFRCLGEPRARFLNGHSTGGWVSLALQVFHPDFFNGAWAGAPDPVDFRSYQVIDIYGDANAYAGPSGYDRPSSRSRSGDVQLTVRDECRLESLLGRGSTYTRGGGQWGAWNATYGPKGADGQPVPLWHPETGAIDRAVAEHFRKYDLRAILERDWSALAPKLRGKLHVWVGDQDTYFLNQAVYRLDDFLTRAQPPYEGYIAYGRGQPHGWSARTVRQILNEMAARLRGPG